MTRQTFSPGMLMVDYVLLVPIILALYIALRRVSECWIAVATALYFVAIATYFASNTAFEIRSSRYDYREKLLLNLANDVCREHLGLAFRLHVQAALSHGVPFSDVLGVVRFIGPYAGYPAAADALERLAAVGAELGVEVRSVAAEASVDGSSEASDERLRPDEGFDTIDGWLAGFIESRTGRSWEVPGLSARERAYLALTADVAQQTLGDSFRLHVRLARESGASPEEIRDVVRFLAECGIAKAAAALRELDTVLGGG